MKILAFLSAASVLALAGAAQAATEVELKNIAARVIVQPEDRSDVKVVVAYGTSKLPVIMTHTRGNVFVADGKLKQRGLDCRDGGVEVWGFGRVAKADLPTIYVKVPLDAHVSAGGATYGTIGATRSLTLDHGGCGTWEVADTSGAAEINIGGSGDVTMGSSREATINIGGSGNFRANAIRALEANIGGNGDVAVKSVDGNVSVNIGGSGNVLIDEGTAPKVDVNVAGSGDVRFGGTAGDVSVSIVGSGDVRIAKATGRVSRTIMGSGNIDIGH